MSQLGDFGWKSNRLFAHGYSLTAIVSMLCEVCKGIRHLFGYTKLVIVLPGGGFALLDSDVRRAKGRSSADLQSSRVNDAVVPSPIPTWTEWQGDPQGCSNFSSRRKHQISDERSHCFP